MSVIVAIKCNGVVYLGADTQITKGGIKKIVTNENNLKIWHIRNNANVCMGHVGASRDASVIRTCDDIVTDYQLFKDEFDYKYVVRKLVPDIINELKQYGYIKMDGEYFDTMESRFIFAYKDKLFVINKDGNVIEVDDYVAIGSGESEAVGSLSSTSELEPVDRIIKAIHASATNDVFVGYPIVITSTADNEFKTIYEGCS